MANTKQTDKMASAPVRQLMLSMGVPIPTSYLLYFLKITVGEIYLSDGQTLKTEMNL